MPLFVKIICFWIGASMILPGICMAVVFAGVADPLLVSNIALPTVLSCWILALATPLVMSSAASKEARFTAFVLTWSAIAIFFPLCWDLPWAIFHDWVNGATAADVEKWYFWAYAVADTRFLNSDPVMVCVEYWSGIIGCIEIYFLLSFLKGHLDKAYRAFLIAGVLQFYGCTVFFGVEAQYGFANIRPDLVSYIKFFGMNGMWMVVPAISGYLLTKLLNNKSYDVNTVVRLLAGRN